MSMTDDPLVLAIRKRRVVTPHSILVQVTAVTIKAKEGKGLTET